MGFLLTNEPAKDTVCGDHLNTNARQNIIGLILLALFIPWDQLPEKFAIYNADLSSFQELYWQIWEKSSKKFEEYALYVAENILHMRKSQID